MEFGKLSSVDNVNWEIPSDDPAMRPFLENFKEGLTHYYVGTPAWGHKEWIGKIYPAKTKTADFLLHYSRNFNTIELISASQLV